jgi:uncharacterized membrane protein
VSRAPAAALFALLITTLGLVWLALVVAAPLAVAHGGAVWPAFVYQAAGLVCHQRPERSFHLAGLQLPVCARCFGLYASGAAGALAAWLTGATVLTRRLERSPRVPLALAAAPTALTVAGEWLGLVQPGNVGRALAAIPLGLLGGWLFVTLLRTQASAGRLRQMRYHS